MAQTYKYKVYPVEIKDPEELLLKAIKRIAQEYNITTYEDGTSFVLYGKDGKPLISLSLGNLLIKE